MLLTNDMQASSRRVYARVLGTKPSPRPAAGLKQVLLKRASIHSQPTGFVHNSRQIPTSTDCIAENMGGILSFLSESFPPKSNFHPDDIPDLTGKVIIVTGASSGSSLRFRLSICRSCISDLQASAKKQLK